MLLILDGFKCRIAEETIAFCPANNIVVMIFPQQTTHVIQSLDVGIFNIYKAAYRNHNTTRSAVSVSEIEGIPYATRMRCIKLAKSLVAYKIISEQVIVSAFKKQYFSQSRLITSSPTTKRFVIPRRRCSHALAPRCKRTCKRGNMNIPAFVKRDNAFHL
jgi:hypothetical protein